MEEDMFMCMDFAEDEEPDVIDPPEMLTNMEVLRWSGWIRPFPLPPHMVPISDQCFDGVDDDVLLTAPPQMIAHIHRTAAQGGLQIISPRQTPISTLLDRIRTPTRQLGDQVVGSIAAPGLLWPTVDGTNFDDLLPDEPIAVRVDSEAVREKTRTEPLTRAPHLMRDPILACLIKGRAVIDILRRDDVMGDADAMSEILAEAWGVDKSDIMEMDAFTIGVDGPLLRHAIRTDDVYPMVHAPIHHKLSISVGSSEISRDLLPVDSAIDWRRLRVLAEAIFLMSCSVEGHSIIEMRAIPPPGDPTASLMRPKILAFQPAACTAWSHEARSFSIFPRRYSMKSKIGSIPKEVLDALSLYVKYVRPMSHVLERGHKATARMTIARATDNPDSETIANAYAILAKSIYTGGARGKNSSRAIRNFIYESVDAAPLDIRLKLARYWRISREECKIHLGVDTVPDSLIDKIATKFLKIGELIRLKVASECSRRGGKIEEWWADITSQVPHKYSMMNEGTLGWGKVAMWLMFKAPSDKWTNLEKAMHYKALREAEMLGMYGVPLPPVLGSTERIMTAARHLVKNTTINYSSYYIAVSDVAMSIADELVEIGKPRSAEVVREGAYLWQLRARALRGTNVNPIAHDVPTPSLNHLRVKSTPTDILIVPAPYRAFESWKSHALQSPVLHKATIQRIADFDEVKISKLFHEMYHQMAVAPESMITKYLIEPRKLGDDMERAWREITGDVREVVDVFGHGKIRHSDNVEVVHTRLAEETSIVTLPAEKKQKVGEHTYFDLLVDMDCDECEWMTERFNEMEESVAGAIMEGMYDDENHLRKTIWKAIDDAKLCASTSRETVV